MNKNPVKGKPQADAQKGRIPRTNTIIIFVCLSIIGAIVIIYPLIDRPIGLDLLGTISLLFVVILSLLDFAGVKILKAIKWVKFWGKEK
ncbi:MAG TPA: hypothetical protein VFF09_00535 [archaeon]|nr:hypothetical protein [archaeon]